MSVFIHLSHPPCRCSPRGLATRTRTAQRSYTDYTTTIITAHYWFLIRTSGCYVTPRHRPLYTSPPAPRGPSSACKDLQPAGPFRLTNDWPAVRLLQEAFTDCFVLPVFAFLMWKCHGSGTNVQRYWDRIGRLIVQYLTTKYKFRSDWTKLYYGLRVSRMM